MAIVNKVPFSEVKEISVTAKRWFQRLYGNTYHSVSVDVVITAEAAERLGINAGAAGSGLRWVQLAYLPFEYGYGRMYDQTALEAFCEAVDLGLKESFPDERIPYLSRLAQESGILYSENVHDVTRKKDL